MHNNDSGAGDTVEYYSGMATSLTIKIRIYESETEENEVINECNKNLAKPWTLEWSRNLKKYEFPLNLI